MAGRVTSFIAIGANLGEPQATVLQAMQDIGALPVCLPVSTPRPAAAVHVLRHDGWNWPRADGDLTLSFGATVKYKA